MEEIKNGIKMNEQFGNLVRVRDQFEADSDEYATLTKTLEDLDSKIRATSIKVNRTLGDKVEERFKHHEYRGLWGNIDRLMRVNDRDRWFKKLLGTIRTYYAVGYYHGFRDAMKERK